MKRDYLIIVDRGTPTAVQAESSHAAWTAAIKANPDAQRIEVKAVNHSLILDRPEPPKANHTGNMRDFQHQLRTAEVLGRQMFRDILNQHPDARVIDDEIVIEVPKDEPPCGN